MKTPNTPGTIDHSFATDGYYVDPSLSLGQAITVLPDDRLLVAAFDPLREKYVIARFSADGTRDTKFDSVIENIPPFGNSRIEWLHGLPNGGVQCFCRTFQSNGEYEGEYVVYRCLENGQVDSSFGSNGYCRIPRKALPADERAEAKENLHSGGQDQASQSAIGMSATSMLEDGSSFYATDGRLFKISATGQASLVKELKYNNQYAGIAHMLIHEGKLLFAGNQNNSPAVFQFDFNGMPDTTFGNAGAWFLDNAGSDGPINVGGANSLSIYQGKVLVVGNAAYEAPRSKGWITRLTAQGFQDQGFNGGLPHYSPSFEVYFSAFFVYAEKLYLRSHPSNAKSRLGRLNPASGEVDPSFGSDGWFAPFNDGNMDKFVLQPTRGRIVTIGTGSQFLAGVLI